jgi:plastocyanin
MRVFVATAIVVFSLATWGCGSSGSGASPVTPTPGPAPTPTPGSIVTINVIGVNGAQSFSPNPATLPAGQMVVWHNIDSITHRVVLNDGTLDTGNLDPGASSRAMAINVPATGDPYHCSIHPVMVGTIVTAASSTAGF